MLKLLSHFLVQMKSRFKTPRQFVRPRTLLIFIFLLLCLAAASLAYQESWLSPFSTLGIPNRYFHPNAFSAVGYIDAADPAHPHSTASKNLTQELLRDLEQAHPLPLSQNEKLSSQDPVRHFILHRSASHFHSAADFALSYYPNSALILFGGQEFRVNQAAQVLLDALPGKMAAGWWKD